jgi:Domain of unknown function (DUF222)
MMVSMASTRLVDDIAAMRAAVSALGARVAAEAPAMSPEELFEVTGELQGVLNAADGAQLVATAHAAAHETRLTDRGPVEVHHELGFVDAMAPTEVSLATGVGQWAAGRRVSLAAALAQRFPMLLGRVLEGDLGCGAVQKVVAACDGLDADACAAVEAVLVDRLVDLDPARVTTTARRVATRVAADQVRAAQRRHQRDRFVQVSPGPDGTTTWWAQLPAAASAAAWEAVTTLGGEYTRDDESLSTDQARADAFVDLLLTNVTVQAQVTLGIPVITDEPSPSGSRSALPPPAAAVGCRGLGGQFRISTALSGVELPGIGWIDADTVETLLATVPLEVGRALLDARTGTLIETTSTAYRPPKSLADFVATRDGACRMWGCTRPASTCDLDHTRPWPAGRTAPDNLAGLCRRHHRLKQRGRWAYRIRPDGTVTWSSSTGRPRTTVPDHAVWPPARDESARPPTGGTTRPTAPRDTASIAPPPF